MNDQQQSSYFVGQVISAIREVVGSKSVPLHEPHFGGNEWIYLKECLDSTFVSSVGKFVDRFEADLAAFTGAKYAVAVVNGTAALHMALLLAGVKSENEVLMPTLTFVATANAVRYCGATPHFVDSDRDHFGIDAPKLREYLTMHTEQRSGLCINKSTNQVIKAMVPMHVFGHPVDLENLLSVAKDFNIALIEDAAESLGSYYHGQHTGTFGLLGALSFNGNKTITTGGGGAILTNDPELAHRAKHLTTTAKLAHPWEFRHDEVGYNYRMPNINAALGCAQLEKLQKMLDLKRELFHRYQESFQLLGGVQLVSEPEQCRSNYWLQTLLLDGTHEGYREELLKATNELGFMTRPVWTLMHELEQFKDCPRMDLSESETLEKRLINIPSSINLMN